MAWSSVEAAAAGAWVDPLAGEALHVGGGHGVDLLVVRLDELAAVAVAERLQHLVGDAVRRLDLQRKGAADEGLGPGELGLGHRRRLQAAQHLQHQAEGLDRRLRLGEGGGDERSRLLRRHDGAIGAVGEAALHADLLVEPRVGAGADHAVEDLGREEVGVAESDTDVADPDLGLHGVGLVDHQQERFVARRGLDLRDLEVLPPLPAGEAGLHLGEGHGRVDVADHGEDGAVGDVVLLVEGHQVVAGQSLERVGGPAARQAVGVVAEGEAAEGHPGQVAGAPLLDLEVRQLLLAPAVDLLLREGRPEHRVGHQIEPQLELVGGDGRVDVG